MKFHATALILLLLLLSCNKNEKQQLQTQTTTPISKNMNFSTFDGKNAFQYLKAQTDFGPRNPNSAGHQKCLVYLNNELEKYADKVILQQFSEKGYGETLRLTNIFASFNPENPKRILLLAHWDSRPRAEMDANPSNHNKPIIGANDGASGVAVLLEIARLLKETKPIIGIDILLTDGEDYGDSRKDGNTDLYFLGARHFMKMKDPNYSPQFGILLDMVGDRDQSFSMEMNSIKFAPHVVDLVWNAAEELGITQFLRLPGEAISDDHMPLNEGGIPTIDIIDFEYPHWHTQQDTPDKCSPESLESVGKVLLSIIFTKIQ